MPCVKSVSIGDGSFKRSRLGPIAGFIDDFVDPNKKEEELVYEELQSCYKYHKFEDNDKNCNMIMKYRMIRYLFLNSFLPIGISHLWS